MFWSPISCLLSEKNWVFLHVWKRKENGANGGELMQHSGCVCAVIKCLGSGVNSKHFKAGAFL